MATPRRHWKRNYQPGSRHEQEFEKRSCLLKIRYSIEPTCTLDQIAYPCRFCSGWHKATRKED
jgi:hypothetical protein